MLTDEFLKLFFDAVLFGIVDNGVMLIGAFFGLGLEKYLPGRFQVGLGRYFSRPSPKNAPTSITPLSTIPNKTASKKSLRNSSVNITSPHVFKNLNQLLNYLNT